MAKVFDVIELMEKVAPVALAEDWDNPGLQVGRPDAEVQHVFLALDPSPEVVSAACFANADLLITHHPLIFSPIKKIDFTTPTGRIIAQAVREELSIFTAHTNLDSVAGGLNDLLSGIIGLSGLRPLLPSESDTEYKLVFFVPESHMESILIEMASLPTGIIGNYSGCSFVGAGQGRFVPQDGAQPHVGQIGELARVDEFRIETKVSSFYLKYVMNKIRAIHPYETVAMDVYPIVATGEIRQGIGRVGDLKAPIDLAGLATQIRTVLGLKSIRVSGLPDMEIRRVALCTGSGSSLLKTFFSSNADVFISGDLKYHDAMDAAARGRGLIDIGHFASEHIIVAELEKRLRAEAGKAEIDIRITAWDGETDPFYDLHE